MRLLNTTTLTFEEFEVTEVPPYAILSHVWGEEEVLYHDIINKTAEQKKGYSKVFHTCQQAMWDGYDWAWIDSCCINKTDGVELTEAINSMYKWYQQADVCYAYLIDVHLLNPLALEPNPVWLGIAEAKRKEPRWSFYEVNFSQWDIDGDPVMEVAPRWQWTSATSSGSRTQDAHDFLEAFSRSTWFTRGWTLQELIAPQQVVFYNNSWTEIGTRKSLKDHIAVITGIEVSALLGGVQLLRMLPAALKMSWASNRYTTKVEDIAYCLLGIFDITMPLLYGEGTKAMIRLQELIFLQTEDYSIFLCEKDYRDLQSNFALSPHCFHRNIQASIPTWAESRTASFQIDFRNIYMLTESLRNHEPPTLSQSRGMHVTIAKQKRPFEDTWKSKVVVWTYWCLRAADDQEYMLCLELDSIPQLEALAVTSDTWSRAWYTPILVPKNFHSGFESTKMFLRTRPADKRRTGASQDKYDLEYTWALVIHMTPGKLPRKAPLMCKDVERPQTVLIDFHSDHFVAETSRLIQRVKYIDQNSCSFSLMIPDGIKLHPFQHMDELGRTWPIATACIYLPERCYFKCVTIAIGVLVSEDDEFWCSLGEAHHKLPRPHHLKDELRDLRKKGLPLRELTDRLKVVVANDEVLTIVCKPTGFRRIDIFGWVGRLEEGDCSYTDPLLLNSID